MSKQEVCGTVKSIKSSGISSLASLVILEENKEVEVNLPIKVKTDFDLIPLELALLNQEIRYCREFHDASSLDNSDWRDRIPGGNIHTQCEIDVMTGPLCGRHYSGYISEKEV